MARDDFENRRSASATKIRLTFVLVGILCLLGYIFFVPTASQEGLIKIRDGATVQAVVDSIEKNIGPNYATSVRRSLNILRADMNARQGAYRIPKGMTPLRAAYMLMRGGQSGIKFTFNNVRTRQEWADRWGSKFMAGSEAMLAALNSDTTASKYGMTVDNITCMLLPDSYEFYWDITPDEMLERMHEYYEKFWTQERRDKAAKLQLTPQQVSILASIVEEETSKADERGHVARLYMNRLNKGMRLQADPTVKFAIGDFSIKRLTTAMTMTNSPYNTYRVAGLPPGPIRLPEKATIDAVLDAPESDDIYMCAREDFSGYHNFTTDYDAHLKNAQRYRAALDARGIK